MLVCAFVFWSAHAQAGGGFLGIDHRLNSDNSGIWNRNVQNALIYTMVGTEIVGAVWEGGETRLGKTFWQSIDSTAIGIVASEAMKHIFTRARPIQGNNPNAWFQGGSHYSFPSGEVTAVTAIVTPFVLEYRHDYPAVYLLELLPVYDAVARMKGEKPGRLVETKLQLDFIVWQESEVDESAGKYGAFLPRAYLPESRWRMDGTKRSIA